MPRSRDILQRFRPAGTPGAASTTGVPADRVAEVSAELEPVIAMLAEAQEQASRIRSHAGREAQQRRQRALERAGDLVVSAHREAAAERADAALRLSRQAEEESAVVLAAAEHDAALVRRGAAERMPSYVDRVMTAINAALAATGEVGP
jgi:hypothetical protein